jgi:elongation factor Ts
VLIEFAVESDFTTQTDEFKNLARDLALHVAANSPATVDALLQQAFVKDEGILVKQLVAGATDRLREAISITRFIRWDTEPVRPDQPQPPRSPAKVLRFGAGR